MHDLTWKDATQGALIGCIFCSMWVELSILRSCPDNALTEVLFSSLFGIVTIQTSIYFKTFPNDSRIVKATVSRVNRIMIVCEARI